MGGSRNFLSIPPVLVGLPGQNLGFSIGIVESEGDKIGQILIYNVDYKTVLTDKVTDPVLRVSWWDCEIVSHFCQTEIKDMLIRTLTTNDRGTTCWVLIKPFSTKGQIMAVLIVFRTTIP